MSYTHSQPRDLRIRLFLHLLPGLLLCLLGALLAQQLFPERILSSSSSPDFPVEVSTEHLDVTWTADQGGDFDPRGKCPDDFFGAGFIVYLRRMADGSSFKFLYHRGRQLLYRIDRDIIAGQARIGLHWVESTRFGARYRVADPAFGAGRKLKVPTGTTTSTTETFRYGQAVSKKRSRPGRELFRATHVRPGQCEQWNDIFDL
jgi:hypothetical protein